MRTIALRRGLAALLVAALSWRPGRREVGQHPADRLSEIRHPGPAQGPRHPGETSRRRRREGAMDRVSRRPAIARGTQCRQHRLRRDRETPPVFAQAAGADLLYVAYEPPAPTSEAILLPKDSPIRSVAELKGRKVALNKGSNVHYLLVRALEQAGLKYSDIQPVYLPPADARAAFERHSVDACDLGPLPGRRREAVVRAGPGGWSRAGRQPPVLPRHPDLRATASAGARQAGGRDPPGRRLVAGQPAAGDRAGRAAARVARRHHPDRGEAPGLRRAVDHPGGGRGAAEDRRHLHPAEADSQTAEHQGRDLDAAGRQGRQRP